MCGYDVVDNLFLICDFLFMVNEWSEVKLGFVVIFIYVGLKLCY